MNEYHVALDDDVLDKILSLDSLDPDLDVEDEQEDYDIYEDL